MANLKDSEILDLAYQVGWRKSGDLEHVLATSLAESGNNPKAVSRTGCCHGLMQINTNSTTKTVAQLEDPLTNMQEAYRLWSARGWQPWNTSRLGQLAWGPRARASLAVWHLSPGAGKEGTKGAVENVIPGAKGVEGVSSALEKARAWITTPANVGRLGLAVVAGIILVIGVATLVYPVVTKTIREVRPA